MLRRSPRPLTLTAGVAALLAAPAASAATPVGSGWQPSRPLWEAGTTAAAPVVAPAAPAAATAAPTAPWAPPMAARPLAVQQVAAEPAPVAPLGAPQPVARLAAPPPVAPPAEALGAGTAPIATPRPTSDPVFDNPPPRDDTAPIRQARSGARLPGAGMQSLIRQPEFGNLPRPYTPPQVPPTEAGEPRTSVVAEELSYDDDAEVVTARGKVELVYEGRVLRADTVRYDTVADRVTAEGDVVVVDTDGTVSFFDFAELTGDMKEGFAREATLLLADRSRATGELLTRENDVNTMREAIYTACDPCEDPNAAPLWRLRADRITHDEAEKMVYYRDAWMEFAGLPVFYTPYLSHPDPTVKRKSGFMPPSYSYNSDLGAQVTIPYYIVIDDQQDAEVALRWTGVEGPVFEGAYSGLYSSGALDARGSITRDAEGKTRGHLDTALMWHFDNTWRGGWDAELASDGTYLRKYRYGDTSDPWLVSEAFLEGFGRRSFARARGFYFQELRDPTDIDEVPVVLPDLTYSFVSRPLESGAWWTFDAGAAALTREDGIDSRRAGVETAFHYPYYGSLGDVTEFMVALRTDGYSLGVDDARLPTNPDINDGFAGRFVPTAGVKWRWPVTRDNGWFREVLEPMASAYFSPEDANNDEIPNEDSRDFEFDAANLFDRNRFAGWDVVETGARVNYGLKWTAYWPEGESLSLLFGQSYHFDEKMTAFGSEDGGASDYVGRVAMDVAPWLNLDYRFRLDQDDFEMRQQEAVATAGGSVLSVSVGYLQASTDPWLADTVAEREQVTVAAHSRILRNWSLYGATTLNISGVDDDEPLQTSFGAIYDDECFTAVATISNDSTEDRDYEGGTEIMFRVVFKTLGEIDFGSVDAGFGD